MISKKFIPDESGVTMTLETVLLFSISIIFLSLVFHSFISLNDRQTEAVMKEEFMARGNDLVKKMFDMNVEAMASLAEGSAISTRSDLELPTKIADNTYSIKLLDGMILLESTSGPSVKVEVPFNSDIIVANESTIYSAGGRHEIQYDSRSNSIFFTDGGVSPFQDSNPPNININSPPDGITISNTTIIEVDVWDDIGVTRVEYYVDTIFKDAQTSGYNWNWNTKTVLNGPHNVTAIAYDAAGHATPVTRTYNISNINTAPPDINIISPPDLSSTNFSQPTIKFTISDDAGIDISSIKLYVETTSNITVNQISNAKFEGSNTYKTITYIPAIPLNVSTHYISVYVVDIDTTKHPTWKNWSFDITPIGTDTTAPTATITSPLADTDLIPGNPIIVKYSTSDSGGSNLDNLTIYVNSSTGNYYHYDLISDYPYQKSSFSNIWAFPWTYVAGSNYTFNITVFDRKGNKNTTKKTLNCSLPGQSSQFEVDPSGINLANSNWDLNNIMLRDNVSDSMFVTIKTINVSWTPSSGVINIVSMGGSNYWNGANSSPGKLTLNPSYNVPNSFKPMNLLFNSDISNKTITIKFELSDSTTKTVTIYT